MPQKEPINMVRDQGTFYVKLPEGYGKRVLEYATQRQITKADAFGELVAMALDSLKDAAVKPESVLQNKQDEPKIDPTFTVEVTSNKASYTFVLNPVTGDMSTMNYRKE